MVVSAASYFFITNYPATAHFLSNEERAAVNTRLKYDNDATRNEAFTWSNVSKAIKDPKCWLYGAVFHTMSLPLYTLSLFLVSPILSFPSKLGNPPNSRYTTAQPTIITELGFSAAAAQLLTVPPYACATIVTITAAMLSERWIRRAPFIIAGSCLALIGYIILLSAPAPGASYFGTILAASGIYSSNAILLSWPGNNVSGQTKRATCNAMQISIGNVGAVIGTQLYRSNDGPRFFVGHGVAAGYLVGNVLVTSLLWMVLKRENERRDRGERDDRLVGVSGEDEWLGDDDPRWRFQT